MSSLYRARVDSASGAKARLTVWQIHPDAGEPPESLTFALSLICWPFSKTFVLAGKTPSPKAPLAQAIDMDENDFVDEAWVRDNARAFVKTFTCKSRKNVDGAPYPEPPYDANLNKLPQAVFELVATDPAWVAHLTPALTWRTAAYDMGEANPAPARHPGDSDEEPEPKKEPAARPTARGRKKPPARSPSGNSRRLEYIRSTSKKFWEIKLRGRVFTTRYGRIGAAYAGETKTQFASAEEARREFEKLIARKLAKGYRDA